MALGLVQGDEEKDKAVEDVGNDIFRILVSNSLFQDVERDEYGQITLCSMHDLVHDLSLSLSKHESLCLVDATNDDIARIPQVKHLAVYHEQNYESAAEVSMFIERNTLGDRIEKLDDSIGGLVHLRYLNLSSNKIRVLPESIGKLYHLQTLKLQGCNHLKKFPKAMRNLRSLRYFMGNRNIPANIVGQLICLRELSSVKVLRRKGHGIEKLPQLNNLGGKLCIGGLENVRSKEDAVKADLSRKKNLYMIEFEWSEDDDEGANRNDKEVLEGLQPPRDVKELAITRFYGDNFPEWVTKMAVNNIDRKETPLDKLVSIRLSGCRSCLSLPTLEQLPHLRDLVLEDMDSLTCLGSSDFTGSMKPLCPSLRSLRLYDMYSLEKWIDGAPNSSKMISPVLQSLEITYCPKIAILDECHPHPLVSLTIRNCTGLVYIMSIQGLTSVESLVISGCPSLLVIANLPNECHSLKTLFIRFCTNLTPLPQKTFDCFALLNELELGPFSKELDSFPSLQGIDKLRNHLHELTLYGVDQWESIPEEIQHLASLTVLHIYSFGMRELPMWLTNMSSIRHLIFYNCKGLNKETVRRGAPPEANDVRLDNEKC
ncbi:hypothetical protein Lser_V15G05578 [Lactuca serriola]